jgi:hypothetical protein
MEGKCELCERENLLTFHHLIPKSQHSNKWFKKNFTREQMNEGVNLCKEDCHKQIHKFFNEKEMGRSFNTLEKLKRHPKVKKYIKYIQKQ